MQPVQRAGHANRLIVRNSKVYASTLAVPHINGLFAFRDIDEGEILVQYKGPILTQKQANESKSEYLFDLWYRSREGAETVVKKTLDGEGELAGFANHAPESLANAKSVDLLPKIIDHDIFYEGRHALVLVAKAFIPKGIEIRFNYNADQGYGGPSDSGFVQKMMAAGVTEQELYSRVFLRTRFVPPPDAKWYDIEEDFEYNHLSDARHPIDVGIPFRFMFDSKRFGGVL